MFYLLAMTLLAVLSVATVSRNGTIQEFHREQVRLISHVLSEYKKDVPPINSRGRYSSVNVEAMVVNISLMYVKLLSVVSFVPSGGSGISSEAYNSLIRNNHSLQNEPEQTIQMIFEYNLYWKDPQLTWDPAEFDNMEGFFVNREQIWRVDVMPYDSDSIVETRDPEVQHVYVTYDGLVEFYVANVVSFLCPLNVKKFPFDVQTCEIVLGSYNFDSDELEIVAGISQYYNDSTASSSEWTVENLTVTTSSTVSSANNYNFYMAAFTFQLRRSYAFYVVLIIIPSFVLTFLCAVGVFWSQFDEANYLEKLGLGFAAILAMCMVLQIAEESIPKTKQLPNLSVYIMVNLWLMTAAISAVVMASKKYSSKKFAQSFLNEKFWLTKFLPRLGDSVSECYRILCLILFPLASIINLLVLIINA